ncbi:hypothetical protein CPC08DRAFT_713792 [Agrocybe pediades]|nr:hypothetical protein CPC08DRAFT_713792 [Agrocybe pediades]
MSFTSAGPEAQDDLFDKSAVQHLDVPEPLQRATLRMTFPPSYVLVGVYRLFTDRLLWQPAWDKCRHAVRRGAIVGAIWTFLTFSIQRTFIRVFLSNSPRITGLTQEDTIFGYKVPFSIYTYATILLLSNQVTYILRFFLARNIRIARDRVWDYTVASRGKGPDFWKSYVEEWDRPPMPQQSGWEKKAEKLIGGWFGLFVVKRVVLAPFTLYPVVGMLVSAWFKALGTSRFLHQRYFQSKKMTEQQIAVFMEERKWDYRVFGFTAALLEGIPILGLLFTVSNRVGAAMWAHAGDHENRLLEKVRLGFGTRGSSKTD